MKKSAFFGFVLMVAMLTEPSLKAAAARDSSTAAPPLAFQSPPMKPPPHPRLKPVGSRGFFTVEGPFAHFDAAHPSVEIWTPPNQASAPVIVYAHGGAGLRDDDRTRLAILRRNGFATISFDAYRMNGFDDWQFVTRHVTNHSKQDMIWGIFQGAVAHAARADGWDRRNIFLYGASNGGRVVLYAGAELGDHAIRGIISEAPAGSGYALGDYDIPTIILFGALDNWAGRSPTDYVWQRRSADAPLSIEDWVRERQRARRPVRFVFYEKAGHLLFEGPLEQVTERRGDAGVFTAYRGAAPGVLARYEKDLLSFLARHRRPSGRIDRNRKGDKN